MRITSQSLLRSMFDLLFAALAVLSICPAPVQAQSQGNNVVYNSAGTSVAYSSSFVDASVFSGDFCAKVFAALASIPAGTPGVVIDARGIQTSGGNLCNGSALDTPWQQGSLFPHTTPSLMLLPAGTISISWPWVIPDRTRIVGEGAGTTVVQAVGSSFTSSSVYMVQFGNGTSTFCPSAPCNGIGVERLTLDGNSLGTGGIQNQYSQERTYVDHVNLRNINGTGLYVSTTGAAQNSGPYSNIVFTSSGSSNIGGVSFPVCVKITGTGPTRGVHGLSCADINVTPPQIAIQVDARGNSIEDVSVVGFQNGIALGSDTSMCDRSPCTQGNVLVNISGGTNMINVVHICGTVTASICPIVTSPTVTDLTVLGVTKNNATNAIDDDNVPISSGGATKITNATVATYAVGDNSIGGGYTRLTTASGSSGSTSVPTWLVGNSAVTVGSSCQPGTLYTNRASSGSATTLYACAGGSSGWVPVR